MKRLLLSISSGILYTLLGIGISLLTTPYFLKFLSKEEFGFFYLANNFIVWTGLLNAGLRGSFKLQFASALGKGEETEGLSTTVFIAQCGIAFAVSLTGFILSFFLASFFDLPANHTDIRFVFIILSFSFACSLISNYLAGILSVHNRDANVYTARSFLFIMQSIVSLVLLSYDWGIKGLALAALLSEIAFFFYMFFLVRYKFLFATFHFSFFNRKLLLSSLSMGKWFLAGFFAQLLIKHTDLFLVGRLVGIDTITAFVFSGKLYILASAFIQMIIQITTPQLVKMVQAGRTAAFSIKMTMLFLKFTLGFIIIAGTGIYIFNESFIHWWVGRSYYLGKEINLMLMLAFLFTSFNLAVRALLLAKMDLKSQNTSASAEGFLHVFLSALFGISHGLHGIAAGIAISSVLASCISLIPFFLKNKNFAGAGRDLAAGFCYILVTLLVLLIVPASPTIINGFWALTIISGAFILLFMKDIRMIIEKILKTT